MPKIKNSQMVSLVLTLAFVLSAGFFANAAASSQPGQCVAALEKSYLAPGYVSSSIIDTFSHDHPILFTELYYRALGFALNKNGFEEISNRKGVFHDSISKNDEEALMDIVDGQANKNIQTQGQVATEMWNYLYEKFRLGDEEFNERKVERYAKSAYMENRTDDYLMLRNYILERTDQKRQIVEFLRLSLPFGAKMALAGTKSFKTRTTVKTVLWTAVTGLAGYFATKFTGMNFMADPGLVPEVLTTVLFSSVGTTMTVKLNPRVLGRNIQLSMLHGRNKAVLEEKGLIKDDGNEAEAFIDAAYLDRLQENISVKDIQSVAPVPPMSTETADLDKTVLNYGSRLSEMFTEVVNYHRIFMEEWGKTIEKNDNPIQQLNKILKKDRNGQAVTDIPENLRIVVKRVSDAIPEVVERIREIQAEYAALANNLNVHADVLEGYLRMNSSNIPVEQQNRLSRRALDLRQLAVVVETQINVSKTQDEGLFLMHQGASTALRAITVFRGNQSLESITNEEISEMIEDIDNGLKLADAATDDLEKLKSEDFDVNQLVELNVDENTKTATGGSSAK